MGGPSVGPAYSSSLASSTHQRQRRAPTNRRRKLSLRQEAENEVHKRSRSAIGATTISKDQPPSGKQIHEALETSPLLAWATVFPTLTEWHLLNDLKTIGTRQGQKPFEELGLILQRTQRIGTPKVQSRFASSVRAWKLSPHFTHQAIEAHRIWNRLRTLTMLYHSRNSGKLLEKPKTSKALKIWPFSSIESRS